MVPTTLSSARFSLPSSSAAAASFQMSGASRAELTSVRRFFFSSKSKIPPEILQPLAEVLQAGLKLIQALGIHLSVLKMLFRVTLDSNSFREG